MGGAKRRRGDATTPAETSLGVEVTDAGLGTPRRKTQLKLRQREQRLHRLSSGREGGSTKKRGGVWKGEDNVVRSAQKIGLYPSAFYPHQVDTYRDMSRANYAVTLCFRSNRAC